MSIDWLTVAAQIVNFLVLVWLLKRFLYRPILNGIDAREAEISTRMSEASRLMQKAEAERARYREQVAALEAKQQEAIEAARAQMLQERDALLAETHERLQRERRDLDSYLMAEKQRYIDQLNSAGASVLLNLARKALTDLADETLEARIAVHAVALMNPMAAELRKLAEGGGGAVVTTHEPLSEPVREKLKADLGELLPGVECRFEVDPSQSPGLVLRVGSSHVAWTIDSYVEELEAMLRERLAGGRDIRIHAA